MWPIGWVEVQLYSSMTAALEGGEWSAARPGRILPPGKTRYPLYRRLGGPQGRSGRAENHVPTGIRSRTVQPLVSLYTDWATRPTIYHLYLLLTNKLTKPIEQNPSLRSRQVLGQWRNSPHFMQPAAPLPHLQVPATFPYHELDQTAHIPHLISWRCF